MARQMRIRDQAFTRIIKPEYVSSIPGVSRILDSNINWCIKIIWMFVLLLMTGLCCWQATNCILVYWSNPVVKETYTIRSPLVQFPVIYYCPSAVRLFEYLFYNMSNCKNVIDDNCSNSNPFIQSWINDYVSMPTNNQTLADLWKFIRPEKEELKIYELCGDGSPDKCTEDGTELKIDTDLHSEYISTFWGTCLVLNTTQEVVYRGPFTYYKILHASSYFGHTMAKLRKQLNNTNGKSNRIKIERSLHYPKVGALISFHQSFAVNIQHFLYYLVQDVYQGFETHIKLTKKEFQYKNRTQDPCGTEVEYIDCINNCFERTTTKDCKMPYIHAKISIECKWGLKFKKPHIENHKAYTNFNFSTCNCRRPCSETVITGSHNVIGRTFNETHLIIKLFFATNTYEKIIEKSNYPFTLCISDIGGHIGFFLGLCILTGVEIIEATVRHAIYLINLKKSKLK